jgi:hypothetical protein
MPPRPKTRYACDEVVFHSNVKVFDANLNLKNVKAFQKDTHVISTPTKKKPKKYSRLMWFESFKMYNT